MSRNKAPVNKHVPREETAEFLAILSELPATTEVAALLRLAAEAKALLNDAIRSNSPEQFSLAQLRFSAVVYRMNGETFLGSAASDGSRTRLLALLAATPGQVPGWGQDGEWLTEVQGLRIRVRAQHWMDGMISLDLYAVDHDQPYLSKTGYRSHFMRADDWMGHEFGAAVRLEIERNLPHKDWKLVPIESEDRVLRARLNTPAWLAPALEGVTRNGQQTLPLSGRSAVELPELIEAEPKAPKSNAERQREFRRRQKEQRELAKADGAVTLSLTRTERSTLSLGLLAHEDLFHRGPDWVTDKKPGFNVLLAKLWPQGDSYYLVEPQRTTYRPAAFLRDELEREREIARRLDLDNQRLRQSLTEITAELKALSDGSMAPAPVAPPAGLIDELRAKIAGLEKWNAQEVAERAKAFEAVEVLQRRLEKAGLVSDYRRQPGE